MVLEEGVGNQMDGKDEKRGAIQKNWRRKESMEHHTPKKNKAGWPRGERQPLRGEYNGGKIEGKASRGRLRDKYLEQIKKDSETKSHREVNELARNRKEWRPAE
jgi:hypothetical protein